MNDQRIFDGAQALLRRAQKQPVQVFGSRLGLALDRFDHERGDYYLTAQTEPWMANADGVVHGGILSTMADQAMGLISYCAKGGEDIAPTIELQISFLRPVPLGAKLLIRVRVLSMSSRLIHMSAEGSLVDSPQRLCFSSRATFFRKH